MAGTIKLDGTQFLEKVNNEFKITNSELKLKSTGNTIVDSSGNAVVSESGGNVTLTTDEANVGSNALVVDSSGNVGIGTSSPSHKLTVAGYSNVAAANKLAIGDNADFQGLIHMESATETLTIENTSDYPGRATIFKDNGTEQMRIDSSGNLKFNSGYGSVATAYGCRAWARFESNGTIIGSNNVSSVSRSNGSYTVNFSNDMPDTNYSVCLSLGNEQSGQYIHYLHTANTGSVLIKTMYEGGNFGSYPRSFCMAIFR